MTYTLDPMPTPVSGPLLSRLARFETVLFGHFLDRGVLDPGVVPALPVGTVTGTAVTLSLPGLDSTLLHHATGLLRPGDILVIDRRGDRSAACLGGGVARAILNAGAAAVIIDGCHTDTDELAAMGLPVFSRGASVLTTRLQGQGGALNRPVSVGGVPILAGDAILADALGVVAIHATELEHSLTRADALLALTKTTISGVEAGQRIGDLSGASAIVDSHMLSEDQVMESIPQLVDAAFAACPEGALGLIYDYAATPFSSDPAKFALPDVIEARGGAERLVADWCGQALYRTDPVQNVAAGITRPFSWSYHPQEPSVIARDLERAEVGEVSERLLGWALARGITVPLHLPAQGFATVTVFLPDGARAQTILADFALAAHRLQDQLTPVLPQLRNPLSPREAECLSLTANGLSAKQIAYALDRSESMVVKHLQAAGVKLGARNRSHAVAIATRQRWIS